MPNGDGPNDEVRSVTVFTRGMPRPSTRPRVCNPGHNRSPGGRVCFTSPSASDRAAEDETEFIIQDGLRMHRLFRDYLDRAAPPVAAVSLALDLKDTVQRYDQRNGTDSRVVTVSGAEIARLYRRTGPRIFARNIRVSG